MFLEDNGQSLDTKAIFDLPVCRFVQAQTQKGKSKVSNEISLPSTKLATFKGNNSNKRALLSSNGHLTLVFVKYLMTSASDPT
jgi:hypothetical protein